MHIGPPPAAAGSRAPGFERRLQGRFRLRSPLRAESSSLALDEKLSWPRCLLTFSPRGLTVFPRCRRSLGAASVLPGHAPSPPSLPGARCPIGQGHDLSDARARRPRSPPAGDSLTQRVVRLVPCRGWIEDVRGEPGAEEPLCLLGAAGRWEGPSPQEPALASFPAATSAKGLRARGLALPSAWLCPTCSGSSGTVTVVLFFRDPDGASLTGPRPRRGIEPAART